MSESRTGRKWMFPWLYVLPPVVLTIAFLVWTMRGFSQQSRLDADTLRAGAELSRLEYVMKRHAELQTKRDALEQGIRDSERMPGAIDGTPSASVGVSSLPPAAVTPRPSPPERNPAQLPAAIAARRQWLDDTNAAIQKGINLEKRLPELEREVGKLQAQFAELETLRLQREALLAGNPGIVFFPDDSQR